MDLSHALKEDGADAGFLMGDQVHKIVGDHAPNGLAHRRPADAEALHQGGLVQLGAGRNDEALAFPL